MKWKYLVISEVHIDELNDLILETNNLEEHILDRLEFYILKKIGGNGNTKPGVLDSHRHYDSYKIRTGDDKYTLKRTVVLEDVKVHVRQELDDEEKYDCSCDSTCMLLYGSCR